MDSLKKPLKKVLKTYQMINKISKNSFFFLINLGLKELTKTNK